MSDEEPTNILVVDDLPEKLLAYKTILDELGQNLITARSGEEALRAVLNHDFAVILLDVNMPGMNGLEAAALIRRRKRSAHTPIIFLTAFADEVRAAEGYAQGAVDYITTPVVPAVLRAKVRVFADLYRMTQQVRKQAEERIALAEERMKREAAEEANRRLAFSACTGTALGQSLDQDVTAREVARLPVPFLADLVVLVILSPHGGEWRTILVRASDDGETLEGATGRTLIPPERVGGIELALAGTPPAPTDDVVVLALRAHGRTFAALALSRAPSGRRFGPADLTLTEAYASRAATALENARLYHEVQLANRQKNEFLSMLAHELRNPLAPIRNATEVLHRQGSNPMRVTWAHGVIDRQLTHLVRIVNDLLDVSRLTLGKIRLAIEPVELASVVTQAVEAARPLIAECRHQLEVTLPSHSIQLQGDPARLTQVIINLLNNAAKYTDPGGRITLTANAERGMRNAATSGPMSDGHSAFRIPHSALVEIRVRDTGVGIPADFLPRVFDLFTQSNRSLDRSQGGLGVGLTLVRRLVEMHGGHVEALSDGPGRGSEFVVRLPAAVTPLADMSVPPTAPSEPSRHSHNGHRLRVVVVDDNIDGVESLADLLGLLGHQVQIANDGPTGIATVRAFDPDVVLLDIGLPGMNGYEVARRLRHDLGTRAVLVAVSGYGREEDRRMSREAGFEQHFVKPMEFSTLKTLLDSIRPNHRNA